MSNGESVATAPGRRTLPPFRADHVGSLLRPPALTKARADFKAGTLDADGLQAVEDAAILQMIAMQHEVGLQVVTDGELRRTSWHMDFIYSLQGVSQVQGESLHVQFKNAEGTYDYAPPAMRVSGKIGLESTIFADAFTFLRDHSHPDQTPQADDPVAEHGPLPRWQRVDRSRCLPGHRCVLVRSRGRLRQAGSGRLRPRRSLPAAR